MDGPMRPCRRNDLVIYVQQFCPVDDNGNEIIDHPDTITWYPVEQYGCYNCQREWERWLDCLAHLSPP
jgi:hypothetical protein